MLILVCELNHFKCLRVHTACIFVSHTLYSQRISEPLVLQTAQMWRSVLCEVLERAHIHLHSRTKRFCSGYCK